jgi:hypothetical protein
MIKKNPQIIFNRIFQDGREKSVTELGGIKIKRRELGDFQAGKFFLTGSTGLTGFSFEVVLDLDLVQISTLHNFASFAVDQL